MPVEIPAVYVPLVARLRTFLNDTAELNELRKVQENTDEELYFAIEDAFDELNYEIVPGVQYEDVTKVPSWNILKMGATLQVLTSKGILDARNTISYSDSGGVTVRDFEKHGRYINYFNVLVNKYLRNATNMKISTNVNSAYGGVPSEYGRTHF